METRESASGVSQSRSSSRLQTSSQTAKQTLVARPSTSIGFQRVSDVTARQSSSAGKPWMQEVVSDWDRIVGGWWDVVGVVRWRSS